MTHPSEYFPLLMEPARRPTTSSGNITNHIPTLRSMSAMHGLLLAEVGDSMVHMDVYAGGSGFQDGQRIAPESDPAAGTFNSSQAGALRNDELALTRDDTLLSLDAAPARNAAELKSLLGNNCSRLKPGAAVLPPPSPSPHKISAHEGTVKVALEQAKPRARVEIDIILESDTCVQGSYLKGSVKVHVQKNSAGEIPIWLAKGRLRIIGFESINDNDRHTFYQCTTPLSTATANMDALYASSSDEEGFARAKEGVHLFPFTVFLPLDDSCGLARGTLQIQSGVTVRYIVMASFKVKSPDKNERSIAHFYRNCEIWPRLNPSTVLSTSPRPLLAQASKNLFRGGKGKIDLTAQLHRLHWIAGQRCHLKISVANDTKKTVKSLTLTLVRTTTIFKPRPQLDALPRCADPDACQTSTTRKQAAVSVLEMGHSGEKGHASAKGWWSGVPSNHKMEFSHFILLPPDALSFSRVRLLEVEYTIRVSLSAGSLGSDVHVVLPVRIINFLSVDPPPTFPLSFPGAVSRQSTIRKADPRRNSAAGGRSTVKEQRVLIDTNGGFAGAPYSYYDADSAPRISGLHECASERSVSVYEDSSSMDEEMLNSLVQPYRDNDCEAGTGYSSLQDKGNRQSRFKGDLQDLQATGITDLPSALRPQGPRRPTFPPSRRQSAQETITSFELRVQEKLRASAPSHAHPGGMTTMDVNVSAYDRLSERLKFHGSTTHDEPSRAPHRTLNVPFALLPSQQLPKPPSVVPKPALKLHLTDPGPVPFVNRAVNDSSAAVFRNRSDGTTPSASRMRAHTQSISRPPLPPPNGSGFSVKSMIADMEEKVHELHSRTDGVIPFC